jgi:hypothetical protein
MKHYTLYDQPLATIYENRLKALVALRTTTKKKCTTRLYRNIAGEDYYCALGVIADEVLHVPPTVLCYDLLSFYLGLDSTEDVYRFNDDLALNLTFAEIADKLADYWEMSDKAPTTHGPVE